MVSISVCTGWGGGTWLALVHALWGGWVLTLPQLIQRSASIASNVDPGVVYLLI